ncbi:MAG: iron-sulfur cluster insertion protein ErpA [Candidatus Aenigmarchaeota archaeon]|nr:iron-sulfur cluster insertion protein ErpA [Candidatus Aenigmarchaeota archaeon]
MGVHVNEECRDVEGSPTVKSTRIQQEQIFKITTNAASKIKNLLDKEQRKNWGLRIHVMPGGCAGFTYHFAFEEKPKETDNVVEDKDVKIFLNKFSIERLKGSTIDYYDALQGSGFVITNPNVKGTCGCGHSFH